MHALWWRQLPHGGKRHQKPMDATLSPDLALFGGEGRDSRVAEGEATLGRVSTGRLVSLGERVSRLRRAG